MYGAIPVGSRFSAPTLHKKYDGGGTFAKGDFVKLSSGELVVATAGDTNILGVALAAGTSSSVNVAVDVTPGLMVIMDNDNVGTTFAATHVGTKFDITGSTGAHLVDTSTTGTTGNLLCLAYNPQGYGFDTDTSIGLFSVDESLTLN